MASGYSFSRVVTNLGAPLSSSLTRNLIHYLDCLGLFALVGFCYILDAETEHERGPVVMADDYQLKYVGMVAAIIGGVVLFLGLVGLIVNLS